MSSLVDVAALLRRAIQGLRPAEREVLALVAWEDLSVADAARALDIPSGSAYRLLHQARLVLRSTPGMAELLSDLSIVKNLT